jgi:hypothetical protein
MIEGPDNEYRSGGDADDGRIENHAGGNKQSHHRCDGEAMAERDRQQRGHDRGAAFAVKPKRYREQPPHRRINAVERPEPDQHQPWPTLVHGGSRFGRLGVIAACD